jgi:pimeloyl-ACP methyl ester carboxylesterase
MSAYAILFALLGVPLLALLAVYFLRPIWLLKAMQRSVRRRGRLTAKSVRVGNWDWPYLEGGPADGIPVVLVHGFGSDKDSWGLYGAQMTGDYRMIAPDLPGWGENVRDPSQSYDIATQAERLGQFLDALGIDRCHLGGNSMGGFIALRFALDHPQRLRSLTLFNNAGVVGPDKSELQIDAEDGSNPLAIQSADDVRRILAYIMHKPPRVPGQLRKAIYGEFAKNAELSEQIFWSIAEDGLQRPLNDRLSEVSVPTLIIWGKHDRLIDVSCAHVLHQGIVNSELAIFDDIGHVPMMENPAASAAVHRPFLAKY